MAEQRAIAAALSDVDGLLGALDRLIAKKRDLKQAAMQQLLTGQTRLPGFKGEWVVKPLDQISTLKGRIGWQGLKQTEFTWIADQPFLITGMNFKDGAIRWDEVYHISEDRYEIAKDIQLRVGDVLMTKDGTIGKILYVDHIPFPGKASLNSHLLLFRPVGRSYDPRFLYFQLNSKRFKDFIELNKSGTTFFGISQSAVAEYQVLLPPLPEQAAIASVLSEMDAELAGLEQRRDKTRALKQGMMQELLTGRTRLVSKATLEVSP
jgi:type I restriction enzyme S subunit